MGIPTIVQNPAEALSILGGPDRVFIGGVEVDVTRLEKKTLRYTTTRHPVEAGLDISDNRYEEPELLRLEGTMTDTPIGLGAVIQTTISANIVGGPGFGFSTWQEKKGALEDIAKNSVLIDIVGRLDVYLDMTITHLDVSQTPDNSGAYPFVIEAESIRQVTTSLVSVDPSQIPKNLRDLETAGQKEARGKTGSAAKKGAKATKDATKKDIDPAREAFEAFGFDTSKWKAGS